jgi:hypothetical protein
VAAVCGRAGLSLWQRHDGRCTCRVSKAPVPLLEVPRETGVEDVAACGAARLFAQQAAMVRPAATPETPQT